MLNGKINITKMELGEEATLDLLQEIPARLKQFAFLSIDDTPEEQAYGWTAWEDMTDTEWREAPPEKGAFMAFSLRIDTRRVPAALVKVHTEKAIKEEFARNIEQGKKFVSRERKKELKEQVLFRLFRRALPTPKQIGMIWDTQNSIVYALTTSEKELFLISEYFERSFDLPLIQAGQENEVLPSQFLQWLWFNSENTNGLIDDSTSISITDKIKLSSMAASVATVDSLDEARLGLRLGKTVNSLSLVIRDEGTAAEWACSFLGDESQMQSLVLPPCDTPDDDYQDSLFLEQMYLIEQAFSHVAKAYKRCQQTEPEHTEPLKRWLVA